MRPRHKTVLCSWHFTKLFCVTQQNVKTSKHEKKTDQKICSNKSGKNGAVVGRKTVLDQVKESFTTQLQNAVNGT